MKVNILDGYYYIDGNIDAQPGDKLKGKTLINGWKNNMNTIICYGLHRHQVSTQHVVQRSPQQAFNTWYFGRLMFILWKKLRRLLNTYCSSEGISRILKDYSTHQKYKIFCPLHDEKDSLTCFLSSPLNLVLNKDGISLLHMYILKFLSNISYFHMKLSINIMHKEYRVFTDSGNTFKPAVNGEWTASI